MAAATADPDFRFSPRPNRAAQIAWQAWDEAAFARARAENKPVLLSLSAVWCHWCHVMDETSYSDAAVIALINARYVAIRVDADRRPDVNARYNMGGWPTTAVLTPDGETITGATYLAPHALRDFLADIADVFRTQRGMIEAKLAENRARLGTSRSESGALGGEIVDNVIESIAATYDEEFAGFGGAPKFPQTDALEFLLLEVRLARAGYAHDDGAADEARLYGMLATTALAMGRAGMYDHVEGGFFRYSTTRDWSVPHFEKMSEDHGGLLRVYTGLHRISNDSAFRETLRSATNYVRGVLRDPQTGLFAGSQDADESYFTLPLKERRLRPAPFVDRTTYVNWSANLCSGLLAAADVLGDDDLASQAIASMDALVARAFVDDDGLARHYIALDGTARVRGLLDDQVWLLRVLLDAHDFDGESRHRERAIVLADAVLRAFTTSDGAFIDNAYGDGALGRVRVPNIPMREGGLLADVLLRLGCLTEDARYATAARRGLECLAPRYRRFGSFAAPFAGAVRRALLEPTVVTIIGEPAATDDFRADARTLPDPLTVVRTFAPGDPRRDLSAFPPTSPRAYVCVGTTCSRPVAAASEIHDAYLALAEPLWGRRRFAPPT